REPLARGVLLQDRDGRSGLRERLGVPALVVVRGERKRNHHRSLARCDEFRGRRRPCAADDQIAFSKGHDHVVNVLPNVGALAPPCGVVARADSFKVGLSRLVDYAEHAPLAFESRQRREQRVVNRARALRAAEDEQREARGVALLSRYLKELAPHGISYNDALAVKKFQRLLERDRRRVNERSEEHTSELQSQSNLVCRLLLEKKKKKK